MNFVSNTINFFLLGKKQYFSGKKNSIKLFNLQEIGINQSFLTLKPGLKILYLYLESLRCKYILPQGSPSKALYFL